MTADTYIYEQCIDLTGPLFDQLIVVLLEFLANFCPLLSSPGECRLLFGVPVTADLANMSQAEARGGQAQLTGLGTLGFFRSCIRCEKSGSDVTSANVWRRARAGFGSSSRLCFSSGRTMDTFLDCGAAHVLVSEQILRECAERTFVRFGFIAALIGAIEARRCRGMVRLGIDGKLRSLYDERHSRKDEFLGYGWGRTVINHTEDGLLAAIYNSKGVNATQARDQKRLDKRRPCQKMILSIVKTMCSDVCCLIQS